MAKPLITAFNQSLSPSPTKQSAHALRLRAGDGGVRVLDISNGCDDQHR